MPAAALRRTSPAAQRNQGPILAELQRLLPPAGRMLEIAAGTGQHALHFAAGLPRWRWQATDPDPAALGSIAAWAAAQPQPNLLLPPLQLDVLAERWPVETLADAEPWDAVFCANMIHIAPWACCTALLRGAARVLAPAGLLITYGPYLVEGEPTSPGNQAFDADLRARDPRWGLRGLHEVAAEAQRAGLALRERVAMPANNLLLVFCRTAPAARCGDGTFAGGQWSVSTAGLVPASSLAAQGGRHENPHPRCAGAAGHRPGPGR